MRILFLHPNFPAQFRHLANLLGKQSEHEIVFVTKCRDGQMAGVKKIIYQPSRSVNPQTHNYLHTLEGAVLQGQAVYRSLDKLKSQGFVPDLVYAHSGWGPGLFIKDVFPDTKYCCYFEWFYRSRNSDVDFDPSDPLDADAEARLRLKNTPILLDLYSCDQGLCPTNWQRQQFPPEYHNKLKVLHDGVDTSYFQPQPGSKLVLPSLGLDLSGVDEIVTYVARGMEPYRGFPQFMEAVALIQKQRPQTHVVVVGQDRVAYGRSRSDGKTYKEAMLEQLPLDMSRLHFTGLLPYRDYLKVLQASSAHIYLTRPFVLSWSTLEAMATGCVVVGSRTPPVQEVIEDGINGLLVDFFSPAEIAQRVNEVIEQPEKMLKIRTKARETIVERYDLAKMLPQHWQWLQ